MSNDPDHTPLPWHVDGDTIRSKDYTSIMMGDYRGVIVASVERGHGGRSHAKPEAAANAALIVRAVNAHEGLVKALDNLHQETLSFGEAMASHCWPKGTRISSALAQARAALALAKGEQ